VKPVTGSDLHSRARPRLGTKASTSSWLRVAELIGLRAAESRIIHDPAPSSFRLPGIAQEPPLFVWRETSGSTWLVSLAISLRERRSHAWQLRISRVTLELGKSPNVVFSDADAALAAKDAVSGAGLYHAGQICFAGTRVPVEESCHEEFIEAFLATVNEMEAGHGLDPTSNVGLAVNGGQMKRVMDYIDLGKQDSRLVMGGHRITGPECDKRNFVAPTLFDEVPPIPTCARGDIRPCCELYPVRRFGRCTGDATAPNDHGHHVGH